MQRRRDKTKPPKNDGIPDAITRDVTATIAPKECIVAVCVDAHVSAGLETRENTMLYAEKSSSNQLRNKKRQTWETPKAKSIPDKVT